MATLIEAKNLKKYFPSPRGTVHAVDDVSFTIDEGTTMGLVGESGCGKSTLGRCLVHLHESTDGQIFFEGRDVTQLEKGDLRHYRTQAQFIFQDPYSSLNPRRTVKDTVMEPLQLSGKYNRRELEIECIRLMDLVGIEKRLRLSYPHELDGGRRQRVGIARALALNLRFIVCDEPVSALDVSIQAQVLNLLMDLQDEYGLTYMFVTHDLSVVRHISDTICVMYLGQMVEKTTSKELFANQLHPYTKALISAIPIPRLDRKKERNIIKGEIVSPVNIKPGCQFAPRCPYAKDICFKETPKLQEVTPHHQVECHFTKEINDL